jgi:hypothetical protein
MLRFNEGDRAILAVAWHESDINFLGEVVEIMVRGPIRENLLTPIVKDEHPAADYVAGCGDFCGIVMDWQLRKIGEPDEPLSLTRIQDQELETT